MALLVYCRDAIAACVHCSYCGLSCGILRQIVEDTTTNEVRRNDQPEIFNRLVCKSGCRAGQSGVTGDRVVVGFAHQGDGQRRRRGGGF